jgi:hypothetical protein
VLLQRSNEDKKYDSKERVYEEFEQVFDHFPKFHMKFFLGDFMEKFGTEDHSKLRIGNGSLL